MPEIARSAFREYDRDLRQPGYLAPDIVYANPAPSALTASQAYFGRFVPSRSLTVTTIAFAVTTAAGADDACDVGLYDSTGVLLVSAGATTGKLNSTGVKTVTVTGTGLQAGAVYYASLSVGTFGGTAAAVAMINLASVANLGNLFGSAIGTAWFGTKAAAHPLASPIGAFTSTTSGVPMLAVRES